MTNLDKNLAALEALLFIHGEPIAIKKIEKALGIAPDDARELLEELEKRLADSARGLAIVSSGETFQLATKPEFYPIAEGFIKSELAEDLTPASLETLAIIAYLGPIPRARIDYQRGVNSSFIVRSLLIRGLIDRVPNPDRAGGYLYAPSIDLIRHLGLSKKEDLPEYQKFQSLQQMSKTEDSGGEVI